MANSTTRFSYGSVTDGGATPLVTYTYIYYLPGNWKPESENGVFAEPSVTPAGTDLPRVPFTTITIPCGLSSSDTYSNAHLSTLEAARSASRPFPLDQSASGLFDLIPLFTNP